MYAHAAESPPKEVTAVKFTLQRANNRARAAEIAPLAAGIANNYVIIIYLIIYFVLISGIFIDKRI